MGRVQFVLVALALVAPILLVSSEDDASVFKPSLAEVHARVWGKAPWDNVQDTSWQFENVNWANAQQLCQRKQMKLCPMSAYCPDGHNKAPRFPEGLTGEQWAPAIDGTNVWINLNDPNGQQKQCWGHHELNGGSSGNPSWGSNVAKHPVLCCSQQDPWPPIMPLQDTEGEQGIQGPMGNAGQRGQKGKPGAKGEPGRAGSQGDPGPPGEAGAPGDKGPKGQRGVRGPVGAPGNPGPEGPMGPKGPKGKDGKNGETGPRGPRGPRGDPGPVGLQGAKGDVGEKGPMGDRGVKGDQGEMGEPGDKGDQGDPGPKGFTGLRGPPGEYREGPAKVKALIKEVKELIDSQRELQHIIMRQELKERWSNIISTPEVDAQANNLADPIIDAAHIRAKEETGIFDPTAHLTPEDRQKMEEQRIRQEQEDKLRRANAALMRSAFG